MADDLQAAIEHHQSGRLAQAAAAYDRILASDAQHADALHLRGVLAYQQGDFAPAVELIGRAIAVRPGVAAFHANLAEAQRALGRFDQAVACCRTALELQPDYPEALNNWGLALLAQGQSAEATERFRAALRVRPNVAMLHNNLGNAVRLQGDLAQAVECFRRAVELGPTLAEARSNLGQALLEQNQRRDALVQCREAVRLCPGSPEAYSNLGNVLRELGQFTEAKACYAEALRLAPRLALPYNNMAQALQEEGHLQEALRWYQQALERDPNSARTHRNVASALAEGEHYDAALEHFRIALRLEADSAEAHNGLGQVLHELGKYPEAVAEYREVIRLKPAYAPGHCSLGHILEELGTFDEALTSFRAALRLDPEHAPAYALMATMLRSKLPEEDLAAMRGLLARPHLAPAKRSALHFGVAQVLDARGDYAEAADHLRRGNGLARELSERQGRGYDPELHRRFVDGLLTNFTPEFFERVRGFGLESERPVFIVGLPRSGTTLTEQILAGHSQVYGAGELSLLRESFEAIPRALERDAALPMDCLPALDRDAVRRLGQWHLDRLAALDQQAARVVDKMPENYQYLGLIAVMFPKARIIHCRRDLRDIAVSCWMTNFRQLRWANDLEHIASRFEQYRRLMAHWQRVLPTPIFEVDYEETVTDLEGVARRLVQWCGLEWQPACLAFHEVKRPVRTASVTQVRQPIYQRSVARWKHYEEALAPLFAKL
jgi:tetratricopeptide (TPR) repeat protein